MITSRRGFLKGCCAGALALGAGKSVAFFDPLNFKGGAPRETLVYLFLRGGMDGLHMIVPYSGSDRTSYVSKRGTMAIAVDRLRPIAGTPFAWHPRAGGLRADAAGTPAKFLQQLYAQGRLAVVQGAGMSTVVNRSHFDTQAFLELGTPGNKSTADGWIARFLQADGDAPAILAPAIGFSGNRQTSLIGADDSITFASGQDFRVDGFHWGWNDSDAGITNHRGAHTHLLPLWNGSSSLEIAGHAAADALATMRSIDFGLYSANDNPDGYQPAGGAVYPHRLRCHARHASCATSRSSSSSIRACAWRRSTTASGTRTKARACRSPAWPITTIPTAVWSKAWRARCMLSTPIWPRAITWTA